MCGMAFTSDDSSRHRRKLGSLVTQLRTAHGITDKRIAARRCSLSVTTYTKIENGESVNAMSYAKLEAGFGMRLGSCRAVLEGADSIAMEDGSEIFLGGRSLHVDRDQLGPVLREAITKWTRLVRPDITLGEDQAMTDGILEELRQQGYLRDSEK